MAIKSRHPHMPFGNLTFAAALAVILANGLVFHDVDSIIYGLIFQFFELLHHQPDDVRFQRLYDGFDCDERRPPPMCRMIGEKVDRGSTILKGYGGYSRMGAMWCCACKLQAAVYHQPRNQAH